MKKTNNRIILYFSLLLLLIGCYKGIDNKKQVLNGILELQRTDVYTDFSKYLLKYDPILKNRIKNYPIKESYKNFTSSKIHKDGVFYNRGKDTVYFLYTLETWIKNEVQLPDSLKRVNTSITSCFLGIKNNDSIFIQKKIQPIIYFNERETKKKLYTEEYRKKILTKFVNYVFEKREVNFEKSYFNLHELNNEENLKVFKPLYSLIEK